MRVLLLVAFCLLVSFQAQGRTSGHVMWETSAGQIPTHKLFGWVQGNRANPNDLVKLTIAVKQQNTNQLEGLLRERSDPKSPKYAQYMSMNQVGDIVRPTSTSISRVNTWLKTLGCSNIKFTPNQNWAQCVSTVKAIENAIPSAHFYLFEHEHRSNPLVRSVGKFEVDLDVASHIDIISGVSDFPSVRQRRPEDHSHAQDDWSFRASGGDSVLIISATFPGTVTAPETFILFVQQDFSTLSFTFNAADLQSVTVNEKGGGTSTTYYMNANGLMNSPSQVTLNVTDVNGVKKSKVYLSPVQVAPWVTSALVRSLYDIPAGLESQHPNNSQAVAEFDDQYYSPSDLSKFTEEMNVPLPEISLQGTNDPSKPGVESTLDIQWILTTGSNVPTTFWYVESGFLTEWAAEVSADPNPPLVHSISYGEPEAAVTPATYDRLNSEFQQLGMRGVTIISTSGDLGVNDGFPRGCNSDTPDFPSSSPWTTSLGASALSRDYTTPFCTTNQTVNSAPVACAFTAEIPCSAGTGQGFTTGGGFSNYNPAPWYQITYVDQYLADPENDLPPTTWFNFAGRGFNDVTALGSNIIIVYNGEYAVTGGTSASGPIVAGLLALINDALLVAGKAPLGFANPFLYATADNQHYTGAFNQITIGDNKCKELGTDGSATCCEYGFPSSNTVWDPVNGLGSPNFQVLRRAALDFQN